MKSTLRRVIAQVLAPYVVVYKPSEASEKQQVIHCWTMSEALAWATCAFNSDLVTIYQAYTGVIAAQRRIVGV